MFEELKIKTEKKEEIVDITSEVKKIVEKSKVKGGLCLVYAKHATASIIINENYDSNVCEDILAALRKIIPEHANYKHNCIDNNASSHIKAALVGPGKTIPIKDSALELGTWQGIALAEFDGPRERHIVVEIICS